MRVASFSILGLLVVMSGGSAFALVPAQRGPMVLVHVSDASVASSNWGGYAVTGAVGSVTQALASWTVPAVKCGAAETSYSAYWVGIDGYSSSTVEQTGTDSDCRNGVATYYAWYEFYPKASKQIGSIVVSPGDEIGAAVVYSPKTGLFYDAIKDFTTGAQFVTSSTVSGAQRSSAEYIVEAPSICLLIKCRLASLSNFGTVGFGQDATGLTLRINCAATIGGVTGPIGSFGSAVQQITMVSQSNPSVVKAQPSALSNDGTSFTATWMNRGP
jgi:Peptidase A4 family